jgi:glycosyltransferase involved in cell wall biosynthesis
LVGELGVGGAVRFLGVREDVPRLMAAADVFMLSSLSEGVSVTLLEAMAAGLPIVATDVGGNGEVVVEGETGLLSPRGDAGALGENLGALMRDGGRRMGMGQAGRARVVGLFDQRRMHERYAELYEQMYGEG